MRYVRKTPLPKKGQVSIGRPEIIEGPILQKLVDAFSLGCTDEEACIYVDISMATLYNYQERHPEFVERKKLLKQRPFLKARNTVVKALDEPDHAEWYLERKGRDEFGAKTKIDYTQTDATSGTNAEIVKNALLAMPPEERAAIISQLPTPPSPPPPAPTGTPS